MAAYKRILLKLSGEALMGDDAYGINRATIVRIVREVQEVTRLGCELASSSAAATSSAASLAARWAWTVPQPTTWACWRP